ncbi:MAG: inositol monophosphatase [Pelagibacteraceae bacterium]|nr:inositol monophosphatase [Pelagibacteraceae bacterium]MBO6488268.1 inositol monophosphatase [Pelagibacteraceae bacterium]
MKINSPQLNLMHRACMKASKVLIRDFGEIEKLQVSEKGPGDFVTASDKRVEKIIINELNVENSKYSVLCEEKGELIGKNKEKRWIIDPIDGTTNFLNGLPHFAISIAYEEKGEILSGIIFDPIKNEMFFAEKGQGAYLNNIRTRVSNKSDFKNSLLVTGGPRYTSNIKDKVFKEYIELAKKVRPPIRKSGSAALDLAYVAAGRFDGSWQRELKYWDIAAGIIILKESGGFINNLRGDNYLQDKIDIVATNSKIHKELSAFL